MSFEVIIYNWSNFAGCGGILSRTLSTMRRLAGGRVTMYTGEALNVPKTVPSSSATMSLEVPIGPGEK